MMMSAVSNIAKIKKIISNFLPESEVILFGSRARGDHQPNSDYDILVISKNSLDNHQRLHFQALIRRSLAREDILADIVIHSLNSIEEKSNLPGHIVRSALNEGVRV